MTRNRSRLVGSTRAQHTLSRTTPPRLYRLDGGHVVLARDTGSRSAQGLQALAAEWRDCHVTAITGVPVAAAESELAELALAAQAFDRVVICASSETGAARFSRAVRAAGRTECHVVADAQRALRHCIDAMIPGDAIVYCCEDIDSAARILAEHGASPVRDAASPGAASMTGTHVALNASTGELTAAHIQKEVATHHEQDLAVS